MPEEKQSLAYPGDGSFYKIIVDDYSAPSGCSGYNNVYGSFEAIEEFISVNREREKKRCLLRMEFDEHRLSENIGKLEQAKEGGSEEDITEARRLIERAASEYCMYYDKLTWGKGTYWWAWERYKDGHAEVSAHEHYTIKPRFVEICRIHGEKEVVIDADVRNIPNTYMHDYDMGWTKAKAKVRWVSFTENAEDHMLDEPGSGPVPGSRRVLATKTVRKARYARCVLYDLFDPSVNTLLEHQDSDEQFWGMPGLLEYNSDEGWLRSRLYLQDRSFEDEGEMLSDMVEFEEPDFRPLLLEVVGDG